MFPSNLSRNPQITILPEIKACEWKISLKSSGLFLKIAGSHLIHPVDPADPVGL